MNNKQQILNKEQLFSRIKNQKVQKAQIATLKIIKKSPLIKVVIKQINLLFIKLFNDVILLIIKQVMKIIVKFFD